MILAELMNALKTFSQRMQQMGGSKGAEPLARLRERLAALEGWSVESVHTAVTAAAEAEQLNLGKLAQPLRVAVSGRAATPPIDVTLALVGRARTLERLDRALDWIAVRAAQGAS